MLKRRPLKMTDWQEDYKRKLVSVEEAARAVKSGDNLFIPSAYYGQVIRAVAARHEELKGVVVEYQAPQFDPGWFAPELEESFKIITRIFLGPTGRPLHDEGRIHFLPYTNSTWFKLYRDDRPNKREIDVTVIEVSPPDEHGFMTFGPHIWERRNFADRAKIVIAEIDNHLIRSHGDTRLHVSQVDYIVDITADPVTEEETAALLTRFPAEQHAWVRGALTMANPARIHDLVPVLNEADQARLELLFGLDQPDDAAKAIAENLKTVLRDRDTVQVGIGKPSKYIFNLGAFDHLNDLSIFSEMACPGFGNLIQRGIATGKYAKLHPGKAVFASLDGMSGAEIRWADDNPLIEQYSSDYVVNIANIVKNDNVISINNAVQIDLTGQITCETQFGPRLLNGPGGQIEFHIGAFFAPGGRAVTLLPSTWASGAISNIVPYLEKGSFVSIPRAYADHVVTEYGVAVLAGKTHRERAEALIAVAHPDHRAELRKAAQEII